MHHCVLHTLILRLLITVIISYNDVDFLSIIKVPFHVSVKKLFENVRLMQFKNVQLIFNKYQVKMFHTRTIIITLKKVF